MSPDYSLVCCSTYSTLLKLEYADSTRVHVVTWWWYCTQEANGQRAPLNLGSLHGK